MIEFIAESGRFYSGSSENYKGDISRQEIEAATAGKVFIDHREKD